MGQRSRLPYFVDLCPLEGFANLAHYCKSVNSRQGSDLFSIKMKLKEDRVPRAWHLGSGDAY